MDEYVTTHTKTLPDGRVIDVFKLLDFVKDRKVVVLDIEKIQRPNRSKRDGFSEKRFANIDVKHPLIVTEEGYVIDGRHRFFKLLDGGVKEVRAIIVQGQDIDNSVI